MASYTGAWKTSSLPCLQEDVPDLPIPEYPLGSVISQLFLSVIFSLSTPSEHHIYEARDRVCAVRLTFGVEPRLVPNICSLAHAELGNLKIGISC